MVVSYDSPWPSTCGMTQGCGDIVYEAITEILVNCNDEQWQQAKNNVNLVNAIEAWLGVPTTPIHDGASAYKKLTKKYEELGQQLVDVATAALKDYPEAWRIYQAREQWNRNLRGTNT